MTLIAIHLRNGHKFIGLDIIRYFIFMQYKIVHNSYLQSIYLCSLDRCLTIISNYANKNYRLCKNIYIMKVNDLITSKTSTLRVIQHIEMAARPQTLNEHFHTYNEHLILFIKI